MCYLFLFLLRNKYYAHYLHLEKTQYPLHLCVFNVASLYTIICGVFQTHGFSHNMPLFFLFNMVSRAWKRHHNNYVAWWTPYPHRSIFCLNHSYTYITLLKHPPLLRSLIHFPMNFLAKNSTIRHATHLSPQICKFASL